MTVGGVTKSGVWTVTQALHLVSPDKARIPLHVSRKGPVTIDITVGHAIHSENGDVGVVSLIGPAGAVHTPWVIRMSDQLPVGAGDIHGLVAECARVA